MAGRLAAFKGLDDVHGAAAAGAGARWRGSGCLFHGVDRRRFRLGD